MSELAFETAQDFIVGIYAEYDPSPALTASFCAQANKSHPPLQRLFNWLGRRQLTPVQAQQQLKQALVDGYASGLQQIVREQVDVNKNRARRNKIYSTQIMARLPAHIPDTQRAALTHWLMDDGDRFNRARFLPLIVTLSNLGL